MAEPGLSDSSSPDTDRDFDPTADMLVHDYDDEHTLEEEEALSDSCSNELDDLHRESDMPLEDLIAIYRSSGGRGDASSGNDSQVLPYEHSDTGTGPDNPDSTRSSSEEEILSNQDLTLDKDEIARDLLGHSSDIDDGETSVNDLLDSVINVPETSRTARLLRSTNHSDDDSQDFDYKPVLDADWKKVIQVGSDYQAAVPEGLSKYGDAPAYENEDRLLWDPNKVDDDVLEHYLKDFHAQSLQQAGGVNAIPTGSHIKDDEQALYLLLQCGHNVEEALRRRKMQAVPPSDPMSLWSEEECRNFENGLRLYGKDFYLIQQNKVKTRSVGELAQFYYLWKKTERHDMFASRTRLEKRKYALHPGVTDYMDRFLDDQENPSNQVSSSSSSATSHSHDRSASPSNVNCLIYGDHKYQQQLRALMLAATGITHSAVSSSLSSDVVCESQLLETLNTVATTGAANVGDEFHTASTTILTIPPAEKVEHNLNKIKSDTYERVLKAEKLDGNCDIVLGEPVVKKLKMDPDISLSTSSSSSCSLSASSSSVSVDSVSAVSQTSDSAVSSTTPPASSKVDSQTNEQVMHSGGDNQANTTTMVTATVRSSIERLSNSSLAKDGAVHRSHAPSTESIAQ